MGTVRAKPMRRPKVMAGRMTVLNDEGAWMRRPMAWQASRRAISERNITAVRARKYSARRCCLGEEAGKEGFGRKKEWANVAS